jgi:predicted metal-dependent phosphoesterase TrpH
VHTKYSRDASISPRTIVDQLVAQPTIKAVAVTDHNTLEGYHKIKELASPYEDILIISGVEINIAGGDVLFLGIEELPRVAYGIRDAIDFAKKRGGLAIVAHPYRDYGLGEAARSYEFDAVEVLNGTASPQANRLARNLAQTMNLPGVAGSDAHAPEELWTVYTEVQSSLDMDEILNAIKKGLVRVSSTGKSIHF